MATSYSPDLKDPVSRVRFSIYDKVAPFRFQDEEIGAMLEAYGFVGLPDPPSDDADVQPRPELLAAIALVESLPSSSSSSSGDSVTMKQGSWSRTSSSGSLGMYDRSGILASLRRRLGDLNGISSGDYGGPVVVDGYANFPCETP